MKKTEKNEYTNKFFYKKNHHIIYYQLIEVNILV